jgi:large subunit ribosomal protein L25
MLNFVSIEFTNMSQITITATKREITGRPVKKLRQDGKIPAVLYGHNVDNLNIELSLGEFRKAFKQAGESTIVDLSVDGKVTPVLIHDVHNHYLTEDPIHVDFFAVNMNEKLTAGVQLHFVGESMAVKNLGGTLVKNLSEVEVECLPINLPPFLEVDISVLKSFEDDIRVSDLKVGSGVEILTNADEVVATVDEPRTEDELKGLDEKPVDADVNAVEGVAKPEDATAASEGEAKAEPEAK